MLKYKSFFAFFLLLAPLSPWAAQTPAQAPVEHPHKPVEHHLQKPVEPEHLEKPITTEPSMPPEVTVNYEHAFTKMLLTLLGLGVLIFLTVWLLRRLSQGRLKNMNLGRGIKILERRPLSAKSILYLIEVRGKQVLIAESQVEVRALTSIEEIPPTDED
jgi:flagellar biogenesis protein FliO